MTAVETDLITRLVADKEQEILPEWLDLLKRGGVLQTGRINESELTAQCSDFLRLFRDASCNVRVGRLQDKSYY
jgi:rsbT co-antagonist protein RsbR